MLQVFRLKVVSKEAHNSCCWSRARCQIFLCSERHKRGEMVNTNVKPLITAIRAFRTSLPPFWTVLTARRRFCDVIPSERWLPMSLLATILSCGCSWLIILSQTFSKLQNYSIRDTEVKNRLEKGKFKFDLPSKGCQVSCRFLSWPPMSMFVVLRQCLKRLEYFKFPRWLKKKALSTEMLYFNGIRKGSWDWTNAEVRQ